MNEWMKIIIPLVASALLVEIININSKIQTIEIDLADRLKYVIAVNNLEHHSDDLEKRVRSLEAK